MKKFVLMLLRFSIKILKRVTLILEVKMIKIKSGKDLAKSSQGQHFENLVDEYFYNEVTDELVLKPIKKDLQAYIESFRDTALDRVLDKFLPQSVETDEVADYKDAVMDLAEIGAAIDRAEEYRSQFGLSDDLSVKDIYSYIATYSEDLKNQIISKGEPKNDEKKETEPQE